MNRINRIGLAIFLWMIVMMLAQDTPDIVYYGLALLAAISVGLLSTGKEV